MNESSIPIEFGEMAYDLGNYRGSSFIGYSSTLVQMWIGLSVLRLLRDVENWYLLLCIFEKGKELFSLNWKFDH